MKYAVLLDGGFFRHKLGSFASPVTVADIARFLEELKAHPSLSNRELYRSYWYDAMPLEGDARRPLRGGRINFSNTRLARTNRQFLRDLCKLPNVSIRQGDLVLRGWRVRPGRMPDHESTVTLTADDLEPDIQQKGVDMRIGLDIASLTMKRHVDSIVLVSGDSDFVPAMKFARREGAQIYLAPLGHGVRHEMLEHSDLVLEIAEENVPFRRRKEAHAA
jgi:uncharacterized LabA/DUF88 family protein